MRRDTRITFFGRDLAFALDLVAAATAVAVVAVAVAVAGVGGFDCFVRTAGVAAAEVVLSVADGLVVAAVARFTNRLSVLPGAVAVDAVASVRCGEATVMARTDDARSAEAVALARACNCNRVMDVAAVIGFTRTAAVITRCMLRKPSIRPTLPLQKIYSE